MRAGSGAAADAASQLCASEAQQAFLHRKLVPLKRCLAMSAREKFIRGFWRGHETEMTV